MRNSNLSVSINKNLNTTGTESRRSSPLMTSFEFFIIGYDGVRTPFHGTNLLVVENRGEREHAGVWIQREHVVRPVGDKDVTQTAVGPLSVDIRCDDLTDAATPRHVLRNVERVGRTLEGRRVVVGVGDLRTARFRDSLLA